ncbi:MAG: GNAT family N-acetyltransferase [Candidatus Dormiibacterota bacterium]
MSTSPGPGLYEISAARSLEAIDAVHELQAEIWGSPQVAAPNTLLRVMAEAGGVVLLARSEERPIGFVYGFTGRTSTGISYHRSHAAGVLPEFRNSGVGSALKLAQRQAVLAAGMDRIVWTFDPSQVGNAHFNLRRLGVVARVFRADYYGQRVDALSRGLPTDRLFVEWFLGPAEEAELSRLRRRSNLVSVQVPASLSDRQGAHVDEMRRRQTALREELQSALDRGLEVIDFDLETRSYRLAELPSSFPSPAEIGPSSAP